MILSFLRITDYADPLSLKVLRLFADQKTILVELEVPEGDAQALDIERWARKHCHKSRIRPAFGNGQTVYWEYLLDENLDWKDVK